MLLTSGNHKLWGTKVTVCLRWGRVFSTTYIILVILNQTNFVVCFFFFSLQPMEWMEWTLTELIRQEQEKKSPHKRLKEKKIQNRPLCPPSQRTIPPGSFVAVSSQRILDPHVHFQLPHRIHRFTSQLDFHGGCLALLATSHPAHFQFRIFALLCHYEWKENNSQNKLWRKWRKKKKQTLFKKCLRIVFVQSV